MRFSQNHDIILYNNFNDDVKRLTSKQEDRLNKFIKQIDKIDTFITEYPKCKLKPGLTNL